MKRGEIAQGRVYVGRRNGARRSAGSNGGEAVSKKRVEAAFDGYTVWRIRVREP